MEQAVDGTAHQAVAEVVEWTLVLLEVGGTQTVSDHHIVAFEDLVHHGRGCVRGVGVVAVGHDVHVGVDVFEHGANHVALALTWLLADDGAFAGGDFRRAVGGVVVVHVDVGIGQRGFEIAHHLADGDFLVVTGKKHGDGNVRIIRHESHYILCTGRLNFGEKA